MLHFDLISYYKGIQFERSYFFAASICYKRGFKSSLYLGNVLGSCLSLLIRDRSKNYDDLLNLLVPRETDEDDDDNEISLNL